MNAPPAADARDYGPRILPHLLLLGLQANLAVLFWLGLWQLLPGLLLGQEEGELLAIVAGLALVMAALFTLSALAASRRLALLFQHPRLRLAPDGIHVRWYRLGWRALLRPRFAWEERRVPWAEFRGCRIERIEFPEFVPWSKRLILATAGPEIPLTWGMFEPSVETLQRDLLDYLQLSVRRAERDAARVPQLQRLLYRQPVALRCIRVGRSEVFLSIIGLLVVAAYFAVHFGPSLGYLRALELYVVLAAAGLAIGYVIWRRWVGATRFIELREGGLSLGPSAQEARLIAWEEIAFARVHDVPGGLGTSLTKLELRLRDGHALYIRSLPEAAQLAALLDPPAERVRRAWELINAGRPARAAALEAGLLDEDVARHAIVAARP